MHREEETIHPTHKHQHDNKSNDDLDDNVDDNDVDEAINDSQSWNFSRSALEEKIEQLEKTHAEISKVLVIEFS